MDEEIVIETANTALPVVAQEPIVDENLKKIEDDAETARANLHDLASKGLIALDELMGIATASQHPRAFEVVANLIKTLSDVNKDIVNLHKSVKEAKKNDDNPSAPSGGTNINNAVFVGSTAELTKLLKKQ